MCAQYEKKDDANKGTKRSQWLTNVVLQSKSASLQGAYLCVSEKKHKAAHVWENEYGKGKRAFDAVCDRKSQVVGSTILLYLTILVLDEARRMRRRMRMRGGR